MPRTIVPLVAISLLLSGCATHRLMVAEPNPTDDRPPAVTSSGFGWGAVQRRSVADCDTNLIDEVRVHQNFGQALATVLTLGAWMPVKIEYRCAKIPSSEEEAGATQAAEPGNAPR